MVALCMRTSIVVADPELPNRSQQAPPSDTIAIQLWIQHTTVGQILRLQLTLTLTPIGKQVNIVLTQFEEQKENYLLSYFVTIASVV
jgi:hypothetical protein